MKTRRRIPGAAGWSFSALVYLVVGSTAPGADTQAPSAAPFEELIRQGEAAEARFDPNAALQCYLEAHEERPRDTGTLLKIAKQYSDSTLAISDPSENRRRIEKALEYSERARELEPHNPVALLSKAICYGKLAHYSDAREKIEYARLVKEFADQALAADPNYAYAHHVLGQWEYEIASIGRTKRFLVALVFGGLPDASTEESVRHLERAVELEPNTASHRLALGFAYLANGEPAKARRSFEQVIAMPCQDIYDSDCHAQAAREIASLKG